MNPMKVITVSEIDYRKNEFYGEQSELIRNGVPIKCPKANKDVYYYLLISIQDELIYIDISFNKAQELYEKCKKSFEKTMEELNKLIA